LHEQNVHQSGRHPKCTLHFAHQKSSQIQVVYRHVQKAPAAF
jgi:hypothetical protein